MYKSLLLKKHSNRFLSTLLAMLCLTLFTACGKEDCYDAQLAHNNGPNCPTVIDPVCACNGQTFNNSCEARARGYAVDYAGACK
jgi:hypothetical protein